MLLYRGLVIKIAPIFSHFISIFSGCRKLSAKGVTKSAHQHLRDADFVNTLLSGNSVRAENTQIVSDHHSLRTETSNKICLSAFDNKRYILHDGIKTLHLGHYELGNYAIDEINWSDNDVEYGYDNSGDFSDLQLSSSPEWDNSFVVPKSSPETNTQSSNTWQPFDPGFLAAELINDSDIESNDIVDFDASSDENSSPDSDTEPGEPVFKTARRY